MFNKKNTDILSYNSPDDEDALCDDEEEQSKDYATKLLTKVEKLLATLTSKFAGLEQQYQKIALNQSINSVISKAISHISIVACVLLVIAAACDCYFFLQDTKKMIVKQEENIVSQLEKEISYVGKILEASSHNMMRDYKNGESGHWLYDYFTTFQDHSRKYIEVSNLVLTDATDKIIASLYPNSRKEATSLKDREYLHAAYQHPGAMIVGQPITGKISGQHTIPVSVGVISPAGEYEGAAVASITIEGLINSALLLKTNDALEDIHIVPLSTNGTSLSDISSQELGSWTLFKAIFLPAEDSIKMYAQVRELPLAVEIIYSADGLSGLFYKRASIYLLLFLGIYVLAKLISRALKSALNDQFAALINKLHAMEVRNQEYIKSKNMDFPSSESDSEIRQALQSLQILEGLASSLQHTKKTPAWQGIEEMTLSKERE